MLYQVVMTIRIPHDADQARIKQLSAAEIELATIARLRWRQPTEQSACLTVGLLCFHERTPRKGRQARLLPGLDGGLYFTRLSPMAGQERRLRGGQCRKLLA